MDNEQIIQNLRDRGQAIDTFLIERHQIIMELSRIRRTKKNETNTMASLKLQLMEEKLFAELEHITDRTERKLREIRERKNILLQNQQQKQEQQK